MKTTIEIEVEVKYHHTPGTPALLSGPPELCFEAEDAETDIESVWFAGTNIINFLTQEQLGALSEEAEADAEEAAEDLRTDWSLCRAEDREESEAADMEDRLP